MWTAAGGGPRAGGPLGELLLPAPGHPAGRGLHTASPTEAGMLTSVSLCSRGGTSVITACGLKPQQGSMPGRGLRSRTQVSRKYG